MRVRCCAVCRRIGETWVSACTGPAHGRLSAVEAQQVQQKIMLERFQKEVWVVREAKRVAC